VTITDGSTLEEFRHKAACEHCGAKNRSGLQPHHVRAKGRGFQLDSPINLIALCHLCHQKLHDGNLSREKLLAIVARREGTDPETICKVRWFIDRLDKRATPRQIEERIAEELRTNEAALARVALIRAGKIELPF